MLVQHSAWAGIYLARYTFSNILEFNLNSLESPVCVDSLSVRQVLSDILFFFNNCGLFVPYIFSKYNRAAMLSIWRCIEITSFSVIGDVIITNLTATSSRTLMCNTFFSRDQGLPIDLPWYEAPYPSLDASEVIINCRGEIIKDLPLNKLRFCDHRSNSAYVWVERFIIPSQKFWLIIPWTCWCWRDLY